MARLGDDLLTEILSRLPIKSLMRFKCVCKGWYSLISNPAFAKLHLNRVSKVDYFSRQRIFKTYPIQSIDYEAFDGDDGKDEIDDVPILSFPTIDPEDWARLIGSCDGLTCLTLGNDFVLCNPRTRELRKFQDSGLLCDEMIAHEFYGFGYDLMSDDYKILYGVNYPNVSKESFAAVFSLKSNSWRQIDHQHADEAFQGGVYLDGALHWYARRKDGDLELDSILSFDLADEKFKDVLPTPTADNGYLFEGLGIHEEHLFIYNATWQCRLEAWILMEKGNGNSWIKWFDVSADGLPGCKYYIKLITCTKSGKVVCQVDEREMVLLNSEDQTVTNIPIQINDDFRSTIYVESLVSPFW